MKDRGSTNGDEAHELEASSTQTLEQRLDQQRRLEPGMRREVTLEWLLAAVDGCRAIEACLTIKPSVAYEVLNTYDALRHSGLPAIERKRLALETERRSGRYSFVTENVMSVELEHALTRYFRSLGMEYRTRSKQLIVIPTFEGDGVTNERHIHMLIEWPEGKLLSHIKEQLAAAWHASMWALPVKKIAPVRNPAAYVTYMFKGGLENLDLRNTWLPIIRIG